MITLEDTESEEGQEADPEVIELPIRNKPEDQERQRAHRQKQQREEEGERRKKREGKQDDDEQLLPDEEDEKDRWYMTFLIVKPLYLSLYGHQFSDKVR